MYETNTNDSNIANIVDNYVYFCYNNKIQKLPLYKLNYNNTVRIFKPFKELWQILSDTSDFTVPPPSTLPIQLHFPETKISELRGTVTRQDGFITWKLLNGTNGPITDAGLPLVFYDLGILFKFTWKADTDVNISFYAKYNNLGDNVYPIFDINNNIASYHGKSGCFITTNYEYIYAAVNRNTCCGVDDSINTRPNFKLFVEVIPPIKIPKPIVPGIQYLKFFFRGEKYKLPVLDLQLIEDDSTYHPVVNPKLRKLQKYILQTLLILSKDIPETVNGVLSVIPSLSSNINSHVNITQADPNLTFFNVIVAQPRQGDRVRAMVLTYVNTELYPDNETFERCFQWNSLQPVSLRQNPHVGIRVIPELGRDAVLILSFEIQFIPQPNYQPVNSLVDVIPQYKKNNDQIFHDYTPQVTFNIANTNPFSGQISLPVGTTSVALVCRKQFLTTDTRDIPNIEFFRFISVTLTYAP